MSAASALLRDPRADAQAAVRRSLRSRQAAARLMSTRCAGVSIWSFMRSSRLVPPAMNLAPGSRRRCAGGCDAAGAFVAERLHVRPPSATSRIAATMLG